MLIFVRDSYNIEWWDFCYLFKKNKKCIFADFDCNLPYTFSRLWTVFSESPKIFGGQMLKLRNNAFVGNTRGKIAKSIKSEF